MTKRGVYVQVVACDVSNREQVLQKMAGAQSSMPVRGILHYAMSYQDISFDKMTVEMFHEGMAAKVLGARNLHEATTSLLLDFFSMVSPFGTVYASPTQSTYLVANNYLYYFARYRNRLGLPATTTSLGFINDLGVLTQDAITVNLFARIKGQTVTGTQVLWMLEPSFVTTGVSKPQWIGHAGDALSRANIVTGVDPAVLANMRQEETDSTQPRWYRDARVSLMLRVVDDAWRHRTGDTATSNITDDTSSTPQSRTAQARCQFQILAAKAKDTSWSHADTARAEVLAFVETAIRTTVAELLFIDPSVVKVSNTVADHGIDSLLAAEFRNWYHAVFGLNISMLELMDSRSSITALALKIVGEAAGVGK